MAAAITKARAYVICGKLRRMMVFHGVEDADTVYLQLMDTPMSRFGKAVRDTLMEKLGFTEELANHFYRVWT